MSAILTKQPKGICKICGEKVPKENYELDVCNCCRMVLIHICFGSKYRQLSLKEAINMTKEVVSKHKKNLSEILENLNNDKNIDDI